MGQKIRLSTILIKVLQSLKRGGFDYYFCSCYSLFFMLPVKQRSACISKYCKCKIFSKNYFSWLSKMCYIKQNTAIFVFTSLMCIYKLWKTNVEKHTKNNNSSTVSCGNWTFNQNENQLHSLPIISQIYQHVQQVGTVMGIIYFSLLF